MSPPPADRLKLRAEDAEDFTVIAACLQDAVVCLGEMTFRPAERRFVAVLDRFTWERRAKARGGKAPLFQVQAGLCFEGVNAVRVQGLDQSDKARVLELLTLAVEPDAVTLVFAGEVAVRLEGKAINCVLEDLEAPRPSRATPRHPVRTGL